jgi:starvation-inducible DNA-binding protein
MPKPSPVVEILRPIAANTALLQLKTHQYHQNTKGINFTSFHELVLDVQYKALVKAVDRVGERIKKLFGDVPVTREYFDLGDIDDAVIGASEIEIIKDLATDNFDIAQQCIKGAVEAQKYQDGATVNLLGDRQEAHEDFTWRLTSMLPDGDRDDFIDELQASVEDQPEAEQTPKEKRLRIKA